MGNPGQPGANGTNGQSVVASSEPAGANCANGGVKLVSASGTSYACNGANGTSGTNGQSVATATEPAGTNCVNGGVQLTSASGKNYVCNGAAGAPGTPTAGLTVLDFEFDETSGTQFADSSGLGNNGVAMIAGIAVGSAGHTGKSINFSGGTVVVPGPSKIPDSPQVWVEAWIFPQSPYSATRTIATKVGSYALNQVGGANATADVQFSVNGAATGATNPCTATSVGGPIAISSNTWYHIAGWYDGIRASVSVNGVVRATANCAFGPIIATPSAAFVVGAADATGTGSFAGQIDELRVRPVAAQVYNSGNSPSANGDLWYNQVVTRVAGPTTISTNGHITATANGKNYYGRGATTVICQQQYGAGSRMCDLYDLMRMMQSNAIQPVSPDVPVNVPPGASTLPTVSTWINAGQMRGTSGTGAANIYNDCFNWSGAVVAGGNYGAMYYVAPTAQWPYGYTEADNCSSVHPLMCCI